VLTVLAVAAPAAFVRTSGYHYRGGTMTSVRVGLLGCGNVGAALVELLDGHSVAIEKRTGLRLELARVAVADPDKARPGALDPSLITGDAGSVVDDPSIEIVVELMGEEGLERIEAVRDLAGIERVVVGRR